MKFIDSPQGPPIIVGICLAIVIALYFYNNPLKHGGWFMMRRFINWLPLGMTYAFLCMGRYNIIVAKGALAKMSTSDLGIIFGVGTVTYFLSFFINGPLIDKKLGGKRGIIIAALGASLANVALGVLTYLIVVKHLKINLAAAFSVLYAINMYFQSYGAMSIIKVKAYWFHVRERGVFGAIFGTLISFGVYFAFDWGNSIINMTKANPPGAPGWLQNLLQHIFVPAGAGVDATWAVFFIPAAILIVWVALDAWLIKDTPEEVGFPHLDTCDASSGQMHVEFSMLDLLKKIFTSRLMLLIAAIEMTSGVFRYSMTEWYQTFAREKSPDAAAFFINHWGLLLCLFGIVGGFAGGIISDKMFQSRRGPPAGLLCGFVLALAVVMADVLFSNPIATGWCAVMIVMASIGITSLMSGTAATDFGGRKATATCSGIVDGFAYLGSGLQSFGLGYITKHNWHWWPIFLVPFAIMGVILSLKIWKALPAATQRYIKDVERMPATELAEW
ncbi:MAG TPA: MFS transporter [Candidatus Polarisedimenticolia bacterium]|nr:MFS transporter [Candidatus Polarisedimenticolia bacterium]